MAFINWSTTLSVSVDKIDSQHKELIRLLNELFDAMSDGKAKEMLSQVFVELLDYTKTHFSNEEVLMKIHEYSSIEEHKKEHDEFVRQVLDLYDNYRSGQATISVPVLNFLRNWLSNHIMTTDKRLGEFLNSKGVR